MNGGNGVKDTNEQILRHLRTFVHKKMIKRRKWSCPSIHKEIEVYINSLDHAKADIIPIHARLESHVFQYFNILDHVSESLNDCTYGSMYDFVTQLDDNLR
jgi:hypothetical protein